MNAYLLSRSLGSIGPQSLQRAETNRLLHAVQPAPGIRFDGSDDTATPASISAAGGDRALSDTWAHKAGVNALVIDRFEGR